jgi:hypothetical protein
MVAVWTKLVSKSFSLNWNHKISTKDDKLMVVGARHASCIMLQALPGWGEWSANS